MARWTSPSDGRLSNGWYPRIVDGLPYVIYGNQVDILLDVRDFSAASLADLPPDARTRLLEARQRAPEVNERGDRVDLAGGVLTVTFADGSRRTTPALTGPWVGDGRVSYRGAEPWLWTQVAGGPNLQVFAYGRPLDGDPRGVFVEMPSLSLQAQHDAATDTWTLAGSAMGNHGTPDYPDGVLHVVTGVPMDRTHLEDHLSAFDFPIRMPAEIKADVWTFGEEVRGTIGNERQGIGLWSASDAAKGLGVAGAPWLDFSKPVFGVWTSPYDAAQGLRAYPDEAAFSLLIAGYRCTHIASELLQMYRDERARGGWNMDAIEERIAVEVCRATGCGLTIYDDHVLEEVPGSEGTRYRPSLLLRAYGLQKLVGTAIAYRFYPDGQADWSFDDSARAATRGDWQWLGLPDDFKPMPVVLTLGLYTQHGAWQLTDAARRLEQGVRIGEGAGAICYDVFGVRRGGETPEWNAWAAKWLGTLLSRTTGDRSRWPRTAVQQPEPPPVVEPPAAPPVAPPAPPPGPPTPWGTTSDQREKDIIEDAERRKARRETMTGPPEKP